MIIRLTFSFEGIDIQPINLIPRLQGQFDIGKAYKVNDMIQIGRQTEPASIGVLRLWGPRQYFCDDELIENYQHWAKFLFINKDVIRGMKPHRLILFTEIYYDGEQCNFELGDSSSIDIFAQFQVALPVSVYILRPKELEALTVAR